MIFGHTGRTAFAPIFTTALDNGDILFVWSRNGINDDVSMTVQGRIYNPVSGTWLSRSLQAVLWSS